MPDKVKKLKRSPPYYYFGRLTRTAGTIVRLMIVKTGNPFQVVLLDSFALGRSHFRTTREDKDYNFGLDNILSGSS